MSKAGLITLMAALLFLAGCLGGGDDPTPAQDPAPSGTPGLGAGTPVPGVSEAPGAPANGSAPDGPPPPQRIGPLGASYGFLAVGSAGFAFDGVPVRFEVTAWLNATADGPYAVLNGTNSNVGLAFYAPGEETIAALHVVWTIDAGVATAGEAIQGPLHGALADPTAGTWDVELYGMADNVAASVVVVVHYV